ncbi:MAG: hypothetical protein IPO25_23300 [Saprospiraceae bacterium]|nr:hypothetical protein [Saprospiraceae bacterium]
MLTDPIYHLQCHRRTTLWAPCSGSRAARTASGALILDERGFQHSDPVQGIIGDPNPVGGSLGLREIIKASILMYCLRPIGEVILRRRSRFVLNSFGTYTDVGNEVTF